MLNLLTVIAAVTDLISHYCLYIVFGNSVGFNKVVMLLKAATPRYLPVAAHVYNR